MSLKSWREQYYPISARRSLKKNAIQHSLTKWLGLQDHALKTHELGVTDLSHILIDPKDTEEPDFEIDITTCALCAHFYKEDTQNPCRRCPLAKARGGVPCDETRIREKGTPYHNWKIHGDPKPMIRWLRKTKRMAERKR